MPETEPKLTETAIEEAYDFFGVDRAWFFEHCKNSIRSLSVTPYNMNLASIFSEQLSQELVDFIVVNAANYVQAHKASAELNMGNVTTIGLRVHNPPVFSNSVRAILVQYARAATISDNQSDDWSIGQGIINNYDDPRFRFDPINFDDFKRDILTMFEGNESIDLITEIVAFCELKLFTSNFETDADAVREYISRDIAVAEECGNQVTAFLAPEDFRRAGNLVTGLLNVLGCPEGLVNLQSALCERPGAMLILEQMLDRLSPPPGAHNLK